MTPHNALKQVLPKLSEVGHLLSVTAIDRSRADKVAVLDVDEGVEFPAFGTSPSASLDEAGEAGVRLSTIPTSAPGACSRTARTAQPWDRRR